MKAWMLYGTGDIRLTEVVVPEPGESEVLIRVKAAGICGSDIPRIYETGAYRMPMIPGHECSGIVERTGRNVDPAWTGRRVAVYPKISFGYFGCHGKGSCSTRGDYDYIGSRRDGAFAEYVTAPASNLLEIPDGVGYEEAAMLEPLAVAANAVRTGTVSRGGALSKEQAIAVCGPGTIGSMTVLMLKEAGYKNIKLIGNKEAQRQRAELLGIRGKDFCNSSIDVPALWLKENSDGGVSAFFECAGRNECVTYGLDAAASGGNLILIGNPCSDMIFPKDTYWQILRKQLTVYGIWNSSFSSENDGIYEDDWHYSLSRIKSQNPVIQKLISHRFELNELEKALHIMRDKTEDHCKIMICL